MKPEEIYSLPVNKIADENCVLFLWITFPKLLILFLIDKDSTTRYGSINKGINIASGDIIGLLHADDIFYDEFTLYKILQQFHYKNDVIYGNIFFCDKENISKINREWISSEFKRKKLYFGWMPPHTSLFIRNNILSNIILKLNIKNIKKKN